MKISNIEQSQSRLLGLGAIVVTLLVTSSMSYDPVNVSKLLAISTLGFALLFSISRKIKVVNINFEGKMVLPILGLYLAVALLTAIMASSPWEQMFFGVFGRNTGLLTYLSFAIVFLVASRLRQRESFEFILKSFFVSGLLNISYCLFQISGNDFIGWNNVYDKILGTFGNPNFISAFLGMFIAVSFAYSLNKGLNAKIRFGIWISSVIAFYEIIKSSAIQGIIVTFSGLIFVGLFYVKTKWKNNIFTLVYFCVSLGIGTVALAGALQKGPLAEYIYKTSVSLRGVYWNTAIEMGINNPFTGLGFDSYGDFYRKFRSAQAMITPGPKTVSNAAHNVILDMFASGGFPLLIAYLLLIFLPIVSVWRYLRFSSNYDGIFVALSVGWATYQLQSIVSINQIGLGVWGWMFSGLVIGYSQIHYEEKVQTKSGSLRNVGRKTNKIADSFFSKSLVGAIFGFAIALPAFAADHEWRSSLASGNRDLVVSAATKWPMDSYRAVSLSITLEENGLYDDAANVARRAVEFNPNSFDSWLNLYKVTATTPKEKILARQKLEVLNPREVPE